MPGRGGIKRCSYFLLLLLHWAWSPTSGRPQFGGRAQFFMTVGRCPISQGQTSTNLKARTRRMSSIASFPVMPQLLKLQRSERGSRFQPSKCFLELETYITFLYIQYFQFLGDSVPPTPLWKPVQEQAIRVTIDNSSVFTPDDNKPQFGFRRSELIAQEDQDGNRTEYYTKIESGITAFHFSVQANTQQQLNFQHEYQPLFIEPNDGTHIFDLQTGMMRARPSFTLRVGLIGVDHSCKGPNPIRRCRNPLSYTPHPLARRY